MSNGLSEYIDNKQARRLQRIFKVGEDREKRIVKGELLSSPLLISLVASPSCCCGCMEGENAIRATIGLSPLHFLNKVPFYSKMNETGRDK
jgi:hypothetical protein